MGAVLAAKRQLLQLGGPAQPTSAASPPSRGAAGRERPALEVLPLLELSAGGLARWVPSAAEAPEGLAGRWQEQQVCAQGGAAAQQQLYWQCPLQLLQGAPPASD